MQLDPQCARLVKKTAITGGTVFLDTNILYCLFGLHGPDLQIQPRGYFRLSRGLGYTPVVSPRTVEEYKRSVSKTGAAFSNYPAVTPDLAQAALSATY